MFRAKKIFNFLIAFSILAIIFSFIPITKAADGVQDQVNETTVADGSLAISGHQRIGQSFTPTMNQLTMVVVFIKNAAGNLDLYIRQGEAGAVLTQLTGQAAINGWNSFDIPNIAVTPGQYYSIYLVASDAATQWSYKGSNTYAGGRTYWDSIPDDNKDFGFKTYGLNSSTPDTPSAPAGTAPSTNISSSIKAPTNVKAENSSKTNAPQVKINWTKSQTSDITGYKVFRKEKDKTYGQVGTTEKNVLEFIDTGVTDSIQYTYMVRTYKSNLESENSNEAIITAQKSDKIFSLTYQGIDDIKWTDPIFLAALGGSILAILGFVLWFLIARRKKKEAEAKK